MKETIKDLSQKLKKVGIQIIDSAKKEVEKTKTAIENTFLEDQLRHRFNLENPYRFEVLTDTKIDVLAPLRLRNVKRYDEDNLFVFYGTIQANDFHIGQKIKDVADNAEYIIEDIVEVSIPVEHDRKTYSVAATAVSCRGL